MIHIETLKQEMHIALTDVTATDIRKCIDHLHSRGYLGGVWQPIETAPKDQSWILTAQDGEVRSNCWFNFDVMNVSKSNNYKRWFTHENPTHWMPLPLPPENKDEK